MKMKSTIITLLVTAAAIQFASAIAIVYRYEFASQGEVRAQGTNNSGYIEFLTPSGAGLLSEVVYDLRITGMASSNEHINGSPLPVIAAPTFSLSDAVTSITSYFQTIEWNSSRIGSESGFQTSFYNRGDTSIYQHPQEPGILSWMRISAFNIDNFWPLEYRFNESSMYGSWLFTGTRNVPEGGTTLAYMIVSLLGLIMIRVRSLGV